MADVERAADRLLGSERVVVLAVGEQASARAGLLWRRDGRVVPLAGGERVYSTPDLIALERRIIDYAASTRGAGFGLARESVVKRGVARRPTIAAEQTEMVRRLTLDGDGAAVVVGQAGSGKTFALAAAREAWEASGCTVVGAAVARRAAGQLEASAQIASTSVAALLAELDRRPRGLPRRAVLVVDEAGMVPTRQLARLVDHADRAGAKLVLVGDHRQLPEIEAGGAFRALTTRLPVIELRENRRQVEGWEREALALLRDGQAGQALRRYQDHGRVVAGDDADAIRQRLVADWWTTRDPAGAVMIAHRRVDVDELNGRARALMRATGALGEAELHLATGGFATSDHVVLRRNDRSLGVVNGDLAAVAAVDVAARTLEVELPGVRVRLDADYLDAPGRHGSALQHAYAITGHIAQGLTFEQTFVVATDQISREWGYSALSRGRKANRLYAIDARPDERDEYAPADQRSLTVGESLATALGRSEGQRCASDGGREQRLIDELHRTLIERDVATRGRSDTVQVRRELERTPPHPLHVRARQRHRDALAEARGAEANAARDLDALREHERTVRDQLKEERMAGASDPSRDLDQTETRAQLGRGRPERVLDRALQSGLAIGR